MTIFRTLFKMMYNDSNYFSRAMRRRKKSKSQNNSTFKSSLFFFLIFTFVAVISNSWIFFPGDESLTKEAQEILFIESSSQLLVMICLVFAVMTTVVGFFSSNDDVSYLPFPVKPLTIFGARYFSSLAITVPAPLGVSFGSIIMALFLFKPFPPFLVFNFLFMTLGTILFFSSIFYLIGCFLSIVFKLKKRKNLLIGILMTLLIVISISISMIMSTANALLSPFTEFIYNSLLGRSLVSLGSSSIVFGAGLASVALILFTAKFTYIKAILGGADGPGKKKKKSSQSSIVATIDISSKQRNQVIMFTKKEFSLLLKSGSYLVNLIIPTIVFSVFLLMTTIVLFSTSILELLPATAVAVFAPLFATLFHIFGSTLNYVSGVSYSKDRLDNLQLATFPIRQKDLLHAKLVPGLALSLISFLLLDLTVLLLFKADLITILLFSLIMIVYTVGLVYGQSTIDLKLGAPSNCNELMLAKNSKMAGFSILLTFLSGAILIGFPLTLQLYTGVGSILSMLISLALCCAFTVFVVFDSEKNIDKRFHRFISNASL